MLLKFYVSDNPALEGIRTGFPGGSILIPELFHELIQQS